MKEKQVNEKRTWPENIKRTKQREAVYNVLTSTEEPLTAAEIYHRLEQQQAGNTFAISTIYRALAVFEENGLVSKSMLIGDDTAVYVWNSGAHKHYAICLKCHKRVPLSNCPFEHTEMNAGTEDFQVTGHKIELYGYCKQCTVKAK